MPRSSAQNSRPARSAPERELPQWYYRLFALTIREDRDVRPWDFDEDLSDLEEPKKGAESDNKSADGSCNCDEGSECDGDCLDDSSDDSLSERSYDGSDADYYYERKSDRKQRKYELREQREVQQKEKQALRGFEAQAETEVEEALKRLQQAFRQGEAPSILNLQPSKLFHLYSVDHVDHCYHPELYPYKYVEFDSPDDDHELVDDKKSPSHEATEVSGHVYFDADTHCYFLPFSPPEYTGLEEHMLKTYNQDFEVGCRFISNDYIIITVPRELVFMDNLIPPSAPETAPARFKFMGIRYNHEKERQRLKRKRTPSPGESLFDMNHSRWT